jgi:hypothetical protein
MSYSFWVWGSYKVADRLEDVFANQYSRMGGLIVDIAGFFLLYLLTKINWKKILKGALGNNFPY